MWIATCALGEDLARELQTGAWDALAARQGDGAGLAYARALAHFNLKQWDEARREFDRAEGDAVVGDAAAVERGFLEQALGHFDAAVLAQIPAIVERAGTNVLLRARAAHLLGVVAFKKAELGAALDYCSAALRDYAAGGCVEGQAQALDSLGMIHQWLGNVAPALTSFAHSLALKSGLGDQAGTAITLGNLGRFCLQLGRLDQARAFLDMDLSLARALKDPLGEARILNDLSRVARAEKRFDDAQALVEQSLAVAGPTRIAFEGHKELLELALAKGDLAGAKALLAGIDAADLSSPYDRILRQWLRAQVVSAENPANAVPQLQEATAGFRDLDLPAQEVEARLALARALMGDGKQQQAQEELLLALKRAKARTLSALLPPIREAMERLNLSEGVREESGRPVEEAGAAVADGYLLRERLGGGAFGTVYRAYDMERGLEVALKFLELESVYDAPSRKLLLDSARMEFEAAGRARHPGLMQVFAMGQDTRGNSYLVQELIRGKMLRLVLSEHIVSDPKRIAHYLAQICDALAALHGQGVIHRDVKPENILLREDGRPVLIDFGIAHIARLALKPGAGMRGSPHYMAPEQANGADATPAFDLYAVGVIAFEWIHGVRPDEPGQKAPGQGLFGSLLRRKPSTLDELIAQMLVRNPADRLSDAAAAAVLFRAFSA